MSDEDEQGTVRYGTALATVTPAGAVRGMLLREPDGAFFFGVYTGDGTFTDYDIRHDDLEVTIAPTALAARYAIGEDCFLDHSPSVLGLEWVPPRRTSG
jgi:hypothetical protein